MFHKHVFAPLVLILALAACPGDDNEKTQFLDARQLVCDGQFAEGAKAMEAYLDAFPNGKYKSRAGLFLGKAAIGQNEFDNAKRWWQWTIDNCPGTLEHHKSRFKLATLAYLLGDTESAQQQFAALANNPDGPLCAEARAWVGFLEEASIADK